MYDYLHMEQSTSFVSLSLQNKEEAQSIQDMLDINLPDWKILNEMRSTIPELSVIINAVQDNICNTLPRNLYSFNITEKLTRSSIEYLMVHGFVPFFVERDAEGKVDFHIELIPYSDIIWSDSMLKFESGIDFPEIQISPNTNKEHAIHQYYVYFYRPTSSSNRIESVFSKCVHAFRDLQELKLYNKLIRSRNATRTLIVNRGARTETQTNGFSEIQKPDFFGDSISNYAQKQAVNTIDLELEKDRKEFLFVKKSVEHEILADNKTDKKFDQSIILPPLCSTEIHQSNQTELDETRVLQAFRNTLIIACGLPRDFFKENSAMTEDSRIRSSTNEKDPWSKNIDVSFIIGDIEEFLGLIYKLCVDLDFKETVAKKITESISRPKRGSYSLSQKQNAFPIQSVRYLSSNIPLTKKPQVSFNVLLQLYKDGLVSYEDFSIRFMEETGFKLKKIDSVAEGVPKNIDDEKKQVHNSETIPGRRKTREERDTGEIMETNGRSRRKMHSDSTIPDTMHEKKNQDISDMTNTKSNPNTPESPSSNNSDTSGKMNTKKRSKFSKRHKRVLGKQRPRTKNDSAESDSSNSSDTEAGNETRKAFGKKSTHESKSSKNISSDSWDEESDTKHKKHKKHKKRRKNKDIARDRRDVGESTKAPHNKDPAHDPSNKK